MVIGACLLFRYLDEQAFRYNNRKDMEGFDHFRLATSQIVSRRLTHAVVSGKTHTPVFVRS